MPRVPKSFAQLWSTDYGLTALVILLVATIFILPPPAPGESPLLTLLFDIFVSLVLLSGLTSTLHSRRGVIAGVTLALVAVAVRWASRAFPTPELLQLNLAISLTAALVLAALVAVQVFRDGPSTMHRVLGSVGIYLLLGLAWSFAYHLIDGIDPDAFAIAGETTYRLTSSFEYLYFSFITLTTVGYGDINAMAPAAKSAALLEALTGQLFPAILIARLVSMEILSRGR